MKGLEKLIESYFLLLSIYLIIVATTYILYNGKYENNKESEMNNNKFKDYEEVKIFLEENYSFIKYKNEDIKKDTKVSFLLFKI